MCCCCCLWSSEYVGKQKRKNEKWRGGGNADGFFTSSTAVQVANTRVKKICVHFKCVDRAFYCFLCWLLGYINLIFTHFPLFSYVNCNAKSPMATRQPLHANLKINYLIQNSHSAIHECVSMCLEHGRRWKRGKSFWILSLALFWKLIIRSCFSLWLPAQLLFSSTLLLFSLGPPNQTVPCDLLKGTFLSVCFNSMKIFLIFSLFFLSARRAFFVNERIWKMETAQVKEITASRSEKWKIIFIELKKKELRENGNVFLSQHSPEIIFSLSSTWVPKWMRFRVLCIYAVAAMSDIEFERAGSWTKRAHARTNVSKFSSLHKKETFFAAAEKERVTKIN